MTCERCGTRLTPGEGSGRRARFCSTRCRVAAHRARKRTIPPEMTSRPRWMRWTDDAGRKRPLTTFGSPASSTDPRTWTTYERASASTVGNGIGYALGDGIGCIDLDDAFAGGKLAPWAQRIVDQHRSKALLIEISPSGNGVHIFLPMDEAPGRRVRSGSVKIETYSRGRYMTVTGKRL